MSIGFDAKAIIKAVGLDHIKWNELPPMLDPANQAALAANLPTPGQQPGTSATVSEGTAGDNSSVSQVVSKATKARDDVVEANDPRIKRFLEQQRDRVIDNIRVTLPGKSARKDWAAKAEPDWWDAAREDALLREALALLYVQSARGSLQVVADLVDGIIPNRAVGRIADDLMAQGASRITGINETTRDAVAADLSEGTRRGYSLNQMIDGVPDEGYRGIKALPVFDDARAEVIARTETMLSYNRAALDAYGEFGVERVLAYDGDYDPECAARDGQTFTIEEALAIDDHPNGTLDWAPVVEKAVIPDRGYELAMKAIDAFKPPVTNVFVEPARPADVHVASPDIHVTPAPVEVHPAVVNVTTPEQVIHVAAAEPAVNNVFVEPVTPQVNVEAPQVHVDAPIVNFSAPEQEAPTIIVNLPEQKKTRKTIEHGPDGAITGIVEEDI